MHSAIYQGYLRHRRFTPRMHRFTYQVFMMYLDLDEVDKVLALSPFWSTKSWRPVRFQRSDFLGDPRVALKHLDTEAVTYEPVPFDLGAPPRGDTQSHFKCHGRYNHK